MRAALVFDLDGTLIDSQPDIHAAANRLLAEEGLPTLSYAAVRGMIGYGVPHLIDHLLAGGGRACRSGTRRPAGATLRGGL